MRVFILSLPALFMCGGVLWLFGSTLLASNKTGRVSQLRLVFARMSMIIGALFLLWCLIIIPMNIVRVGYPLVIGGVGLLLIIQGWAFQKYKFF